MKKIPLLKHNNQYIASIEIKDIANYYTDRASEIESKYTLKDNELISTFIRSKKFLKQIHEENGQIFLELPTPDDKLFYELSNDKKPFAFDREHTLECVMNSAKKENTCALFAFEDGTEYMKDIILFEKSDKPFGERLAENVKTACKEIHQKLMKQFKETGEYKMQIRIMDLNYRPVIGSQINNEMEVEAYAIYRYVDNAMQNITEPVPFSKVYPGKLPAFSQLKTITDASDMAKLMDPCFGGNGIVFAASVFTHETEVDYDGRYYAGFNFAVFHQQYISKEKTKEKTSKKKKSKKA